jgi:hypothetical protein
VNRPVFLGGEFGRIFYTGGHKPKGQLIYLLKLYDHASRVPGRKLKGELEEALFLKSYRDDDHAHFRRLDDAIRDKDKPRWSNTEKATHYVFVAGALLQKGTKRPSFRR